MSSAAGGTPTKGVARMKNSWWIWTMGGGLVVVVVLLTSLYFANR